MDQARPAQPLKSGGKPFSTPLFWGLFAGLLALAVFAYILRLQNTPFVQAKMAANPTNLFYETLYANYLIPLATPVYALVGTLIAIRKPKNPIAWLCFLIAAWVTLEDISWQISLRSFVINPGFSDTPVLFAWIYQVTSAGWLPPYPLILMLYLFPSGKFTGRLSIIGAAMAIAGYLLVALAAALAPNLTIGTEMSFPNPTGGAGAALLDLLSGIGRTLLVVSLILCIVLLIRRWLSSSGTARQQFKWLVYAGALVVVFYLLSLGYTLWINNTLYNPFTAAAVTIFAIGFPAAIGIAILKYRLYDIDLIVNRTLVYSVLSLSIGLIYFGIVLLLQQIFQIAIGRRSDLAIVASTLITIVMFNPLRLNIQRRIDRRFYRRKYDAEKILASFSNTIRDEVDMDRLTTSLVDIIEDSMQPKTVGIWVSFPHDRTHTVRPAGQGVYNLEMDPVDPLFEYLKQTPGVIQFTTVHLDSPDITKLKESGMQLLVPFVSQNEVLGLISVGPRMSGQDYSTDDRKLLNSVALQATPAVKVAQLALQNQIEARQRERMEQEMRVARIIQETLLPQSLPVIPGWELAVDWRPARAVGGDFYDFIPFPDGRLGIVAGDVTDKGTPAALVMASTRSFLRAAAEQYVDPGKVLKVVNERLTPDMPEKMFVTCLYGVLDPQTGEFAFANAGHNFPLVHSPEGVVELKAKGMPLGLLRNMRYEETQVVLKPGSCVVLYSDGIVEAHNPAYEMFGFPRMQALLHKAPCGSDLIAYLNDQLAQFTGPDWEQEDDVTFVTFEYCLPEWMIHPGEVLMQKELSGRIFSLLDSFQIGSRAGAEREVMERVATSIIKLDIEEQQIKKIKTAVAEAAMNAIEHGNQFDPNIPVNVWVGEANRQLLIQVTDRGGDKVIPTPEAPDLDEKLTGSQSPRGWGLFLIQSMVDEMINETNGREHTLSLVINLEGNQ